MQTPVRGFEEMKTLTSYSKNKHDFELVIRSGDIAIFRGKSQTGSSETFEVIHVQSHDGREVMGKHCPPAEYPPSNEQWGSKGFTFATLEAAGIKFAELT